jgi:hypothetical protein
MYNAATGKLFASTSIYDFISDRSSMAISDDGSVAVIQERDDTFGHNKIAAYRFTGITPALKKLTAPCRLTLAPSQPVTTLILLVC